MLAVTASAESPVDKEAHPCIAMPFADEKAVVQTRFATSVLALWRASFGDDVNSISRRAEDQLMAALPDRLTSYRQFAISVGRHDGVHTVAVGPRGLAGRGKPGESSRADRKGMSQ